jgi:predicted RNA binding protein YcfA (HicA-like mRNA interferase family)
MSSKQLDHCRTSREITSYLSHRGATCSRQSGSHSVWHGPNGAQIIVPCHAGDLKRGTLSSIIKMIIVAGLGMLFGVCYFIANFMPPQGMTP